MKFNNNLPKIVQIAGIKMEDLKLIILSKQIIKKEFTFFKQTKTL